MADFIITGFSSTAQTLDPGQTGVLPSPGDTLLVTDDVAVTVGGSLINYLTVNGSLIADSSGSIFPAVEIAGNGLKMLVGPTGFVSATNSDAITGSVQGVFDLQNAGTIMSGADAIDVSRPAGGVVPLLAIANSGTIQGAQNAVRLDAESQPTRITNSGTILAETGFGISQNWLSVSSTGTGYLYNTGTISGPLGSYTAANGVGVNNIYNAGLMVGTIYLDDGNDRYEGGAGRVVGRVYGDQDNDSLSGGAFYDELDGGSGNDLLVGRGGDDYLYGGADQDFVIGGDGNDEVDGGFGHDTVTGNGGDDLVIGGPGNDLLVGQDGSDTLQGDDQNDTLDGGAGNDILEGGDGTDVLRGRNGEDELAGGLGLDFLTGGQDADVFVFRTTAQAGIGATRDQVLDFEQGLDVINVVAMAPGNFEFRGTAAFAPSGNPELRLIETAAGSTIVQFDTDGDGAADAEIRVANVTGLTETDFAL
ncbi:hypothetical protein KZZ07_12365 [Mameliella sp. CS4]|uniref:calcium-binding protein n=1 Tax=Mameliella sp. CS4 TaxID=2862329 RepID=UPI001C5E058F|nr:calcium-binding protein [Mameliella sp. CS4]MBW4983338.1 hypothetical protein [Mameliella sp. CS4]